MITREEYLKALAIVEAYHRQVKEDAWVSAEPKTEWSVNGFSIGDYVRTKTPQSSFNDQGKRIGKAQVYFTIDRFEVGMNGCTIAMGTNGESSRVEYIEKVLTEQE